MKTRKIEIDQEVWDFLQSRAVPLVDTPNSVLRRLLLRGEGEARRPRMHLMSTQAVQAPLEPMSLDAETGPLRSLRGERLPGGLSSRRMGQRVMTAKFPGEYFERADRSRGGFRTMFESEKSLVYVLNFNKPDARHMLFRVTRAAIEALVATEKSAWVIFSNPARRVAWVIPVEDVLQEYREENEGAELPKTDLVVNIDVEGNRLRELDWDISAYRWEIDDSAKQG